jgi:hypothetical protein
MGRISATTRSHSTVRFDARVWDLDIGSSVTFGRSSDSDIVIPRQAQDLLVSRKAGRLTAVDGGLLVSNMSTRNSIYLQGIPGPEIEIKPLMTLATMPFSRCRLVVFGSHAARYVLDITCGAAEDGPAGEPGPASTAVVGVPTTAGYRRLDLPDSQRRYLAALCEPVLTAIGAGTAPATYRGIAERCGVSPRTVRNSFDALRQMLAAEYGIPGLVHVGGPDGEAPGAVNFLAALAAWAVHSGTVDRDDLEALDP